MKSVYLAFLFVAIVLLAAVESRRVGLKGRKRGGNRKIWQHKICMQERPRNCSEFVDETCVECDDGFALKEVSFPRCNKTICVPCKRAWRRKQPEFFLDQCINECPRNCSVCEDGVCKECEAGFHSVQTRLIKRTICVPCGPRMKRWPDVYLKECKGCGNGCANCSAPGICAQCNEGLLFLTLPNSNITRCVPKCPPFFKLDKDSSRCELKPTKTPPKPNKKCGKGCAECSEEGICLTCQDQLRRIKLFGHVKCMKVCPPAFKGRLDPESQIMICGKPVKIPRKGGKNTIFSADSP